MSIFMGVKVRYRCRGCGEEWEVEEKIQKRDGLEVRGWVKNLPPGGVHECGERKCGKVDLVGAEW
jgi:hypothetical protein